MELVVEKNSTFSGRHFREMNYELPPFMRYVNAHLTGRPLHTFLWFIWLTGSAAGIMYWNSLIPARSSVKAGMYAVLLGLLCVWLLVRLVMISTTVDGKRWLNSMYRYEEWRKVRLDMRVLIGAVPYLALLALLSPLFW